jgi:ribosomal protein L37E
MSIRPATKNKPNRRETEDKDLGIDEPSDYPHIYCKKCGALVRKKSFQVYFNEQGERVFNLRKTECTDKCEVQHDVHLDE